MSEYIMWEILVSVAIGLFAICALFWCCVEWRKMSPKRPAARTPPPTPLPTCLRCGRPIAPDHERAGSSQAPIHFPRCPL